MLSLRIPKAEPSANYIFFCCAGHRKSDEADDHYQHAKDHAITSANKAGEAADKATTSAARRQVFLASYVPLCCLISQKHIWKLLKHLSKALAKRC